MRLETITADALEKVGNDRYILSVAVSQRVEQLAKGATPMIDVDVKKAKLTDIALMEIAAGKIAVSTTQP